MSTTKRARSAALQADLELLDTVRDQARDVLRALLTLQSTLDADPVRFAGLNDRNIDACDHYMKHVATLTTQITTLDRELSDLHRLPAGTLLAPVRFDKFGEIVGDDGMVTPGILAELEVSK